MARINFEDDVEAQDEFWELIAIWKQYGEYAREVALGRLLRFFRLAQKAWGHDHPMTQEDLLSKGFEDMIKSGWAVPIEGGYHALGAKKHFAWYRQRVVSGENRSTETRNKRGQFSPKVIPAVAQRSPSDHPATIQPLSLSLSLSPALSLSKNKEGEGEKKITPATGSLRDQNLEECKQVWLSTLRALESNRSLSAAEETEIARALQREKPEVVKLALYGARFEKPIEDVDPNRRFDPKKHIDITRVLLPNRRGVSRIQKFYELGAAAVEKKNREESLREKRLAAARELPEELPSPDPERVEAILNSFGIGGIFKSMPKD